MKKQTAVKWLWDCIPSELRTDDYIKAILKKAKEMEKQQIIDARHNGRQDLRDNGAMYKEDEQYYNEIYGK